MLFQKDDFPDAISLQSVLEDASKSGPKEVEMKAMPYNLTQRESSRWLDYFGYINPTTQWKSDPNTIVLTGITNNGIELLRLIKTNSDWQTFHKKRQGVEINSKLRVSLLALCASVLLSFPSCVNSCFSLKDRYYNWQTTNNVAKLPKSDIVIRSPKM